MKTILFASFIFVTQVAVSATFTSNATGDWNDPTTWGLGACSGPCIEGTDYPGSSDDVTISAGTFVTVTADHGANTLLVEGDASYSSGLLVNSTYTLTIVGDMTCQTTVSNADLPITIDGNLVVGGTFSYDLKHADATGTFTIASGGTGDFNGTTNRFRCTTPGTGQSLSVNLDGTADFASALLLLSQRATATIYLTVNDPLTTAGLTMQATTTTSSVGVDLNDIFDCNGTLAISRTSGGAATDCTIDMLTAGAEFLLSGTYTYNATTGGFIDAHASNSSRFVYDGAATQTIANHANVEYHDLVISNTHTNGATLGADLPSANVLGDIIIETGGLFAAGTRNITHDGDWIENGTGSFTQSSGTVTFNGSALQTITGTVNFPNDVIITNTSVAGVVLDATSSVTFEVLTINTNGVFKSNGADFTITGNISNAGTFTASNDDIVTFSGSGVQTITGTNPIVFQDVVIANTAGVNTPTGSDVTFEDVTINSGAILDIDDETINVTGNWTNNNGVAGFTPSTSGEVVFSGAAAQTIGGSASTTFKDLTISNTFGTPPQVSVSTAINIEEVLDVTDGQLDGNNLVTLVSNTTGTAVLADLSNGTPENPPLVDIIAQRFINETSNPGWYMLASPMTNTTLEDWDDDVYTSGMTNSDDDAATFVSIQYYDESASNYGSPVNTTQSHNNGADESGWFVYSTNNTTIDVTGTLRTGTVTMNGLTNGGDGWHLLGNPYAAHVAWNNTNLTNITGATGGSAFVLMNDGSGNYEEYDHATGTDMLASGEAFWVHASGTGTVEFAENDKPNSAANDNYNSVRLATQNNPKLNITMVANSETRSDETRIELRAGAADGYEWYNETHKMGNANNYLNIATLADSMKVLHNSIDDEIANIEIPLVFYRQYYPENTTDNYALTFNNVKVFTDCNKCLFLQDTVANTSTKIDTDGQVYNTSMQDDAIPRLFLNVSSPLTLTYNNPSCETEANGSIIALGQGAGPFDYTWLNSNGDTLRVSNGISTADTLTGILEGKYTVIVTNNGVCGTVTAIMEMEAPLSTTTTAVNTTAATCKGGNDGTAAVSIPGGNTGYTFLWPNGSTDSLVSGLNMGNYTVTISNGSGCTITKIASVSDGPSIIDHISTTHPVCYGANTGSTSISPINTSGNYTYNWSTGETTAAISGLMAGDYQYTITETGACAETGTISITQPTEMMMSSTVTHVTCNGEENGAIVFSLSGGSMPHTILWDNGSDALAMDSLAARDYQIRVFDSLSCEKVFTVSVTEPGIVTADFDVSSDTVMINEVVVFTNTSASATDYNWNFGDGYSSTLTDPAHSYSATGDYTILLESSIDGNCEENTSIAIHVNDITVNGEEVIENERIQIIRQDNIMMVNTSFEAPTAIQISLYNVAGQELIKTLQQTISTGNIEILLPETNGAYFMVVRNGKDVIFNKIIK
jgi:hypothetical protein